MPGVTTTPEEKKETRKRKWRMSKNKKNKNKNKTKMRKEERGSKSEEWNRLINMICWYVESFWESWLLHFQELGQPEGATNALKVVFSSQCLIYEMTESLVIISAFIIIIIIIFICIFISDVSSDQPWRSSKQQVSFFLWPSLFSISLTSATPNSYYY